METIVLERYLLNAERAFEQRDYLEGKRLLFEALTIQPDYGKAHNHLGWLYLFQIIDWVKAENHLRLALKYLPEYSAPYVHMAHLLFEKGKFDELSQLLERALEVGGVQKSFVYNEYGRILEANGKSRQAVKCYKKAVKWTFNDQDLIIYKDNIRRCRDKRWILMF